MSTVNDILTKMIDVNVVNHNEYVKSVESLAQEMINAEFSLIWTYNKDTNSISTINSSYNKSMGLNNSIMKEVWSLKKSLYHNHITSHKSYNSSIDNPLSLDLKSMIILPILDKTNMSCIGFITAFNSTNYNHLFKRYDIKVLEALLPYGRICLDKSLYMTSLILNENKEDKIEESYGLKEELLEKELQKKELEIQDLKEQIENMELFQDLDTASQQEVDSSVMALLESTTNSNENIEYMPKYEIELFNNSQNKLDEQIRINLDFMLNELNYKSKEEHDIYHFIELIKNALHDKGQLKYIEKILRDKDFLYAVSSDYYTSRSVKVVYTEVNVVNLFEDIVNLYSINMSSSKLSFNIFINPYMPKYLLLDKDLIQSILIPLINNIYAFTNEFGALEVLINYDYPREELTCRVYGLSGKKSSLSIKKIFRQDKIENTLDSNKVGLGLSISSNLIKLLKGTLEIQESEKNGKSFLFTIPAENFSVNEVVESATNLEALKIGILMNEKNKYAYKNFLRYIEVFGISENKLFIASDYKECEDVSLTHLFCFDNMLHKDMNLNLFSSFIILKYDLYKNYKEYLEIDSINELYLNFHYGRKLKKLLFPALVHENTGYKALVIEEKLSSKFKNTFLNKLLN